MPLVYPSEWKYRCGGRVSISTDMEDAVANDVVLVATDEGAVVVGIVAATHAVVVKDETAGATVLVVDAVVLALTSTGTYTLGSSRITEITVVSSLTPLACVFFT